MYAYFLLLFTAHFVLVLKATISNNCSGDTFLAGRFENNKQVRHRTQILGYVVVLVAIILEQLRIESPYQNLSR